MVKSLGDEESDRWIRNCAFKLRDNATKRREKVYVGCGAGFAGDRPVAALKLLQRVTELNYLVLECLAERTLADRFQNLAAGGCGYDPRIAEWMHLLLPLALERGTCIITNMGAVDPVGAQEAVLKVASNLGLRVLVSVVQEASFSIGKNQELLPMESSGMRSGSSTYLGAGPIVECLEKYQPNVVITSRVADAALFLAPMVYELGWNWNDLDKLAQGTLAGHLLECGCQLTGGYFMHPSDKFRDMSLSYLLDLSLPYVEVTFEGNVCVAKAEDSGGVLNFSTCCQQLLYEVGDPSAYVTPDLVLDIRDVSFHSLSLSKVRCTGARPSNCPVPEKLLRLVPQDCGWKGWGEISYGGYDCVNRAKAAEYLVRTWIEECLPGHSCNIVSYIIGFDSLKTTMFNENCNSYDGFRDIRLRMDGLFDEEEQAKQFTNQFLALYTNGPAGGGGISTRVNKEMILQKHLTEREKVFWEIGAKCSDGMASHIEHPSCVKTAKTLCQDRLPLSLDHKELTVAVSPAPAGQKIPLFKVAHSRAGDKGNDLNFSIIPHFLPDIERLKIIITLQWVQNVVSPLLSPSSFPEVDATIDRDKLTNDHIQVEIYEVRGVSSLNVVVRNILDGGVNCSRRIDRHGKTISDIILCQEVELPP